MKVTDEMLGTLSYAGAIVTGPVMPLFVYLGERRSSPFVRQHAAQALNVALTWLLYAVSGTIVGALLAFDNSHVALFIMVPIAVAGWLVMAAHLVWAAAAARRGGFRRLPSWACATLVK